MSKCSFNVSGLRSFRITVSEKWRNRVEDLLRAEGFEFEPEPFSSFAFRLTAEPVPLGSSLAAFFGLIYIQDRSSMLPAHFLNPPQGAGVLDMCASPGSKTGYLAQLIGKDGFVLGNEPNPTRLGTLRANLSTLNFLCAATCRFPGQEIAVKSGLFSHVLLDPPCSGWGTVERNPKVLDLWTADKAQTLVGLQRLLLAKANKLIAPGGTLVYSTCTTNVAENEEQVLWAQEQLGLVLEPILEAPGFTAAPLQGHGADGALRIDPGKGEGQGFFLAKFTKPINAFFVIEDEEFYEQPKIVARNKNKKIRPVNDPVPIARSCLENDCFDLSLLPAGDLVALGNNVMFMPQRGLDLLGSSFPFQGCFVGKLSGSGVLPLPRMRAIMCAAENSPCINVEDVSLIKNLLSGRSHTVDMPGRSWSGLYYKDLALGLLRVKGGRAIWTER